MIGSPRTRKREMAVRGFWLNLDGVEVSKLRVGAVLKTYLFYLLNIRIESLNKMAQRFINL